MLMCTRGVTADKALEMQERWRTPREFVDAFEKCGAGGGGEGRAEDGKSRRGKLVMDRLGGMVARRKVGKVLSAKVAEVWGEG